MGEERIVLEQQTHAPMARGQIDTAGMVEPDLIAMPDMAADTWYSVGFVFVGGTSGGGARYVDKYIDGVKQGSGVYLTSNYGSTGTSVMPDYSQCVDGVIINGRNYIPENPNRYNFAQVTIDDILVYNSALTSTQMLALHNGEY